MSQSGTGTPASRNRRLERSLSTASAEASGPRARIGHADHVEHRLQRAALAGAAVQHREQHVRALRPPASPARPPHSMRRSPPPGPAMSGSAVPTCGTSSRASSSAAGAPRARDPPRAPGAPGRAAPPTTWAAPANATVRSAVAPPVSTVIRIYRMPASWCSRSYRVTIPVSAPLAPHQRGRGLA